MDEASLNLWQSDVLPTQRGAEALLLGALRGLRALHALARGGRMAQKLEQTQLHKLWTWKGDTNE